MFVRLLRVSLIFVVLGFTGASSSTPSPPKLSSSVLPDNSVLISVNLNAKTAKLKPTVRLYRSINGGAYARVATFAKSPKSQSYLDIPGSGAIGYRAISVKSGKKSKTSAVSSVQIGGNPTPRPGGSFDAGGNVTEAGKLLFGIPSSLSGNVAAGKAIVDAYCTCHAEKTNRTFPTVKARTAGSPMFFSFSDPELANITAYLNRFR